MRQKKIKCVVWDLDNTIWEGVLLENEHVQLKNNVQGILDELDKRGILLSIASKNIQDKACHKLKEFGILDYFIYPQINWNTKSSSIKKIAASINIGLDTIAFVDDQPFELEEVGFTLPEVYLIDAEDINNLLDYPCMNPAFITEDGRNRRSMYQADIRRNLQEENFEGPKIEFLESLGMELTISRAKEEDLLRIEELTLRTHQLNSTGYIYSYEELVRLCQDKNYLLLIAGLKDRFGEYGKVGFALIKCQRQQWSIKLLLMSCRVVSKGIGYVLLNYIIWEAHRKKKRLNAYFRATDSNRMMYIALKFSGFTDVEDKICASEELTVLEHSFQHMQPMPEYVKIFVQ